MMSSFNVNDEIKALRRMRWSELERVALEAGLTTTRVREAKTLDELRRAVLLRKCETAGVAMEVRS